MNKTLAVFTALLTTIIPTHHHKHIKHTKGCNTDTCDKRVGRSWWKKYHRFFGFHHETASSTCYAEGTTTASGQSVFVGEVAMNKLPLWTKIKLDHPIFGRRI